ncbi:MAG TPA: M48 family metalloprotease [Actinomycetes bacterium]
MKLTTVALVGGPTMLVLVSPWVAARLFEGRAPARTVATFHLLALAGMAALPLVALPCLALIRPSDLSALASLSGIRVAQTAARALAVAYLARIGWVAVRTSRATSRLAANLAVAAAGRPAAGGPVTHLVASARPFAYTLGGRAGGVVVSHGLLSLLDRDERDAVLAHERAHLRLRHHRLLWFGQVVSAALGAAVPAAGEAAASLARELEVIADQAAASEMGERRVVARALAKAALASATSTAAPSAALAFGGERDLVYRLDRLMEDRRHDDRRGLATAAIGLLDAGLLAILGGAVQPTNPVGDVVLFGLALAGIGWLSWRAVAPLETPAA